MDPVIYTLRLKLTLITKAEKGSPELKWIHELRSDEKAMFWSIMRRSECLEDTEKAMRAFLPTEAGEEKTYRVVYAVHEILEPTNGSVAKSPPPPHPMEHEHQPPTRFIGLVNLVSCDARSLALPPELTIPTAAAATTLTVELAYSFLPVAWGRGYATESVLAVFEAGRRARAFWAPFEKVYVRVIVNGGNAPSQRVMAKTGMAMKGIHEFSGQRFFVGGEWTTEHSLHIFGLHLLE